MVDDNRNNLVFQGFMSFGSEVGFLWKIVWRGFVLGVLFRFCLF